MEILTPQRPRVNVLKLGPDVQPSLVSMSTELLSMYRPGEHNAINNRLKKHDLFLKMEGVGSETNNSELIRYQFEWFSRARSVIPDNIPEVQMLAEVDGRKCYVMERVRAETIEEVVRNKQHINEILVNDIVRLLYDIVDKIHDAGLIHGDMSLENVMVKRTNTELEGVVVLDPLNDAPSRLVDNREVAKLENSLRSAIRWEARDRDRHRNSKSKDWD